MATPRAGLCSTRVLVMDRLRGTRMLDVMRAARLVPRGALPCPPAVARVHGGWAGLVRTLHLAWGQQVLVAGVFHTDPHPGNLLLLDDGRLGILDWGQTKRLRPEHVTLLCRMAVAMCAPPRCCAGCGLQQACCACCARLRARARTRARTGVSNPCWFLRVA
jgi:predicted unusual protein kinase regulating ubiquinone biosynthesis (AarF/ABC1/UbiB family)